MLCNVTCFTKYKNPLNVEHSDHPATMMHAGEAKLMLTETILSYHLFCNLVPRLFRTYDETDIITTGLEPTEEALALDVNVHTSDTNFSQSGCFFVGRGDLCLYTSNFSIGQSRVC